MMEIKRISTADAALYAYMEDLLVSSFPKEEYRELNMMREYTDNSPVFYNNIIFHENNPVGFITYWKFDRFYYAEHFAIDPNRRNGGYGQKLLEHLSAILELPIVLEVEMPETEIAGRRINFYQRQGFALWKNNYYQPPYRPDFENIPMYLMVKGELDSQKDFEYIKDNIYRVVYGK